MATLVWVERLPRRQADPYLWGWEFGGYRSLSPTSASQLSSSLPHCSNRRLTSFSKKSNEVRLYGEIISRLDPLSGSGFHSIHPDPPRSAPDTPSSAPTGSGSAQIQARASFQIWIYIWVLRSDLDFCLSTRIGSYLALIHARASLLIWIFIWVLELDLVLLWSMPEPAYWSESLSEYSD